LDFREFCIIDELIPAPWHEGLKDKTLFEWLTEDLDIYYTERLEKVLTTTSSDKILMIFTFWSKRACSDYSDTEYSTLNRDFTEYINYSVYGKPITESNIFMGLREDCYAQTDIKGVELYIEKLKERNPGKTFSYIFLPYYHSKFVNENDFPKDKLIMNLNPEYYQISCLVTGAKRSDSAGKCMLKCFFDFKNFETGESKIFIIFLFDAYVKTWSYLYDQAETVNTDIVRKHLADYINHSLYDSGYKEKSFLIYRTNRVIEGNIFAKTNELWYDPDLIEYTDGHIYETYDEVKYVTLNREMIDETVLELKAKFPSKVIKYIVLPAGVLEYKYMIL
jgi:hypothetical protein